MEEQMFALGRLLVLVLALCTVVFESSDAIGAAPTIEWELKQPFRYFKYRSDFEIHRWAYESLKAPGSEPTILDIEHTLNDRQWWIKKLPVTVTERLAGEETLTPLELLTKLRVREIGTEGRLPGYLELAQEAQPWLDIEYDFRRLGWSSLLFPAHRTAEDANNPRLIDAQNVAVCWNRAKQRHSNCPDYLVPKDHIVVIRLTNAPTGSLANLDCMWRADTSSNAKFLGSPSASTIKIPCSDSAELRIPSRAKVNVTLEAPGLATQPINPIDIDVKDVLIVGIGDSFSSGEGNPDVPAKMKWTPYRDTDPLVGDPTTGASSPGFVPLRKADGDYFAAQWIDRACHRSAYGYQLRVAIHLAVKNPRRAITFLGYACSGAEINEGLFNPYMGPEAVQNKRAMEPYEKAQIPLLLSELCSNYNGDGVRKQRISESEEDQLAENHHYGFMRAAALPPTLLIVASPLPWAKV
jgi:hypothetical protein